jgi:hypothetical protein
MAVKSSAKRKIEELEQDRNVESLEKSVALPESGRSGHQDIYTDILRSLFEKNRRRVAKYYCPNTGCHVSFWDAEKGCACPGCGHLGIISEFRHNSITKETRDRNIIGYVDTLGRLICCDCILKYGIPSEVGLIVYDDTEPFCFDTCDMCKETLGRQQN